MNARSNKNNQTSSFYKMKKFSISALSLIICGFTASSALADTYSNQKCAELSWQYDDLVQMQQGFASIAGMCQIGRDNICTRTDEIEGQLIQDNFEKEADRLKDELITYCPSYTEGL